MISLLDSRCGLNGHEARAPPHEARAPPRVARDVRLETHGNAQHALALAAQNKAAHPAPASRQLASASDSGYPSREQARQKASKSRYTPEAAAEDENGAASMALLYADTAEQILVRVPVVSCR